MHFIRAHFGVSGRHTGFMADVMVHLEALCEPSMKIKTQIQCFVLLHSCIMMTWI